jgi:hypothetical protein
MPRQPALLPPCEATDCDAPGLVVKDHRGYPRPKAPFPLEPTAPSSGRGQL